jgi:PilZ domain
MWLFVFTVCQDKDTAMIESAINQPVPVPVERRHHARLRTLLGANLRYPDHISTLSGMVRNLSAHGARLELHAAGWVPERFELEIPQQNIHVPARVTWRKPEAVGVEFELAAGASLDSIKAVAALKQENDRLKARIRTLTDET